MWRCRRSNAAWAEASPTWSGSCPATRSYSRAALLGGGALADRIGVRRTFPIGLATFAAASAVCGAAPVTAVLIAARLLQGLGAALMVSCTLSLVQVAAVPGAPARPRAADVPGQLAALAAAGGLTFALIEAPTQGWLDPRVLGALVALVAGVTTLIAREGRIPAPLLDPALLRRAGFVALTLSAALLNLAFYGQVFVLGLFFQRVRGEDALTAGLSFLPMTGLIALAMLATPRLIARLGATATIVTGQLCCALAVLGAQTIDRGTAWWALALLLPPMGLGGGIAFPPLTTQAMADVPEHLTGTASGAFNATRQLGAAVGVAVFGGLLGAATGPSGFVSAMHVTQIMCAALLVAAVGLACWGPRAARARRAG